MRDVRISVSTRSSSFIVKVDGALTREGLAEFEKVVSQCEGALCLELSELRSLDDDCLTAIQGLLTNGAQIVGASPYMALLIKAAPDAHKKIKRRRK